MSCCTNRAMACIFCSCVVFPAVKPVTCCLIASDASICPLTRFPYQLPISAQFANSFFRDMPPAGKNDTIIWPATPFTGGISGSCRSPLTSLTTHCDAFPPPSDVFNSGWESHEALYSQPAGSRGEIERVLLLDRIVLALRRDAPAMQTSDFSARIEIDAYRAMFSPFGPQNLVGLAHLRPDLIHRQNGHVPLGIQQHRVGLLIVRRQRGPDQCAHPLWSLTGHGPRLSGHKRYSDPKENLPHSPASY